MAVLLRRLVPLVLVVLGCVAPAAHGALRPNVLVIETDDQTVADLASMPNTRELIGAKGITFDRSIVSLSQCCPSRATLLTGRYAQNHGVLSTSPPFGGFDAFDDRESLAVWLQRAGYATALVGKYLNGYGRVDASYVPPGWTEWHGLLGPSAYQYYRFRIVNDGVPTPYPGEYQTDVLTRISEDVIRRRAAGDRPFFLWTTYVAPHVGGPRGIFSPIRPESSVPAPIFSGAFFADPLPRPPSYNEADVSDKPEAVRRRPRIGPRMRAALTASWRLRQESLLSVDEGVSRLFAALREAGALEHTLVVFTSDNGYLFGEHRVMSGKVLPYEPSIRVPLMLRGPGVPSGQTRDQLVWNGDLAPTILAATGAKPAWQPDGMSLWPFIRDASAPDDRAVLIEGPPRGAVDARPRYTGVRTARFKYVEHMTGELELYDLARDPDELQNLAGRPGIAAVQRRLGVLLERLRRCSGAACRVAPGVP